MPRRTRSRDCTAVTALEDLGGLRPGRSRRPLSNLELKRELFARLEAACDRDAVLATNTSSLSVTAIAGDRAAARAGRAACTSSTRRR